MKVYVSKRGYKLKVFAQDKKTKDFTVEVERSKDGEVIISKRVVTPAVLALMLRAYEEKK